MIATTTNYDAPATLVRGYRFALDPTIEEDQRLRSHCGAARFAFNHMLAAVVVNLDQRSAERSYGIAERELTPMLNWTAYGLRKTWNQIKDRAAPWWSENSKEAYAGGAANLAAALANWSASRSGQRRGNRVRFPRFKTKRSRLSCRFTTGAFGLVSTDRRHVRLPRIGVVRTHESTRKLARRVEARTARIRSATISFERGRWFVSFTVELHVDPVADSRGQRRPAVVGVDLGITYLAVLSSPVAGVTDAHGIVANSDRLDAAQQQLRRLQRQASRRRGPDKRTGVIPSARWRRTNARIARLHARIADARTDKLHQLSTALVNRFAVIVVEDLNVSGMLANHRLARRISAAGWGELRRQLDYKTRDRGHELVVADRFYPSSKTCSNCGAVKAKLRPTERLYHCTSCSITLDRDLNAASNLAALAVSRTAPSSPSCGATLNEPAGNPQKTSSAGSRYTATGSPSRTTPHEQSRDCR